MISYERRLFGAWFVASGAFLLVEHVYRFGFEVYDIIGHEWLGLLLIFIGVLTNLRWSKE